MRLNDWFAGAGGTMQGAASVPFVDPVLAANHDDLAIQTHATNFPDVEHFCGDIKDLDVAKHPYAELFWASPECTNWSVAKGRRQDYADHPGLFDEPELDDDVQRSRALMEDVVRYLRGMARRGEPVLAGVVENVVDVRRWIHWDRWLGEIQILGYRTRLIAINSAHVAPIRTPRAPQSRDRLYVAYWHESLGRTPDWDRWLNPVCWCPDCGIVAGVQTWKRPGQDMGRYGAQYFYRCPNASCRGRRIEPFYRPAREAIDWTLQGQRIGDRDKPLSPKTMARIEAALLRWGPSIIEAAGNQYDSHDPAHPQHGQAGAYSRSWPITEPLRTLHTTNTKGLLVPVEGRDGKHAVTVDQLLRTQTARNDLAIVTTLRGQNAPKTTDQTLDTVAASGNHHGLLFTNTWTNPARTTNDSLPTLSTATTQGLLIPAGGTWHDQGHPTTDPLRTLTTRDAHGLLVPHYSASTSGSSTSAPMGTLTSRDRFALMMRNNTARGDQGQMATPADEVLRTLTTAGHQSLLEPPSIDILDCLFRMLEPHEIGAGMAFLPNYVVLGNKRQKVKQYGNAVTPPVAEVLVAALVECILGRPLTATDWGMAA